MSITLVPEEVKEDTYNKMSPRYRKIYKKNLQPIFVFNHETLNGLNVASTYVYDDPEELKDPRHFYDDYSKLIEDVETGVIKYGTPITFTGTVGGIKYQNKITSYGRLRLSKIIGADIDTLDLFKNPPYEAFKAGSALKLVQYLYKYDDFVEGLQDNLGDHQLKHFCYSDAPECNREEDQGVDTLSGNCGGYRSD